MAFIMISGIASQYDPGVMQGVINTRLSGNAYCNFTEEDVNSVDGFIAVESCDSIGEVWLVRSGDSDFREMLVTDCSGHQKTSNWMIKNNILLELDYRTAKEWDTVGRSIEIDVLIPRKERSMHDWF